MYDTCAMCMAQVQKCMARVQFVWHLYNMYSTCPSNTPPHSLGSASAFVARTALDLSDRVANTLAEIEDAESGHVNDGVVKGLKEELVQ